MFLYLSCQAGYEYVRSIHSKRDTDALFITAASAWPRSPSSHPPFRPTALSSLPLSLGGMKRERESERREDATATHFARLLQRSTNLLFHFPPHISRRDANADTPYERGEQGERERGKREEMGEREGWEGGERARRKQEKRRKRRR